MEDGSPDELESVVDGLVDPAKQAGLSAEAFVESVPSFLSREEIHPQFPYSESA